MGSQPGAGRPSKLTEEVQSKICKALMAGNFRVAAAGFAGVSYSVFRDWMRKGEENPDSIHGEFCRAVIDAEKKAEIQAVALIMKAAARDPRHAQWWLTHRWPERWGEKTRLRNEMTGKDGAPLFENPMIDLTREELVALAAEAIKDKSE